MGGKLGKDRPYWDKLESIPLAISEKEYIYSQHIYFVFIEERLGREFPLGQSVIPLMDSCDSNTFFSEPIYLAGKLRGTISGMVGVTGLVSVG